MTRVQKAVFPGFVIGCLALVFFASLAASPHVALASNPLPAPAIEMADLVQEEVALQEVSPGEKTTTAEFQPVGQANDGSSCSISSAYPESIQQWCDFIDYYARENHLDPNLIAAVMLQESSGNSQAYSKSGAVGLMQVMPRDGLANRFMCINGPCFASRPSMQELYDPEFNISYGTNMLAGLIQKHGDVREALRAYGPMDMGYRYADIVLSIFNRY